MIQLVKPKQWRKTFYFDLSTLFGGRYRDPAIRGDWPNGLSRCNHVRSILGQTPEAFGRVWRPQLVTKLLVTFGSSGSVSNIRQGFPLNIVPKVALEQPKSRQKIYIYIYIYVCIYIYIYMLLFVTKGSMLNNAAVLDLPMPKEKRVDQNMC